MRGRNTIVVGLLAIGLSLGLAGVGQATLIDRGGGMIFDDDLGITWLSDANLGAGSAFEAGGGVTAGRMNWQNAKDWAASLTVGGFDDWRLPTADPACGFAFNCTGSEEMGHLFYNELGGTAASSILTSGDPDLGLFTNLQADIYWTGTEFVHGSGFSFGFSGGNQNAAGAADGLAFAWAVRSGDVSAAVPEPGTLLLFGTGMVGLIVSRRWVRRRSG